MNHETMRITVECPECSKTQTFMSQDLPETRVVCPECGIPQVFRRARVIPWNYNIHDSKTDPDLKDPASPQGVCHTVRMSLVDGTYRFISHESHPITQQEYDLKREKYFGKRLL